MSAAHQNPSRAQFVVIGAGCIGCSVAYHLTKAGITDILVLEREPAIASVTTAQAAGHAGQVRSTVDRVKFEMASVQTYRELQKADTYQPSWRETGSIRIALSDARVDEFRDAARVAEAAGLDIELMDGGTAKHAWPHMRLAAAKAVLWCPSDGYLQPVDLANAYHYHARLAGAKFCTGLDVLGIETKNGTVAAVLTDHGRIECETVINCAGSNAWAVANMVGLEFPIFPIRHQYMITTPIAGITPDLPLFRVPDLNIYGRPDVHSLLLGGWESTSTSIDPRSIAAPQDFPIAEPNMDAQNDFVEAAAAIFPPVRDAGVRSMFSGWPTVTSDGLYIIGRARQVRGFVMGTGCNIHGVGGSAGFGRMVADSITEATHSPFLQQFSPDRFSDLSLNWDQCRRSATAISENYYTLKRKPAPDSVS